MAITPLVSYQAALNYDGAASANAADSNKQTPDNQQRPNKQMASFKKIIARMNNSIYIYPTISVLVFTISTIFIVFSKSINILYKFLAILILIIYIAITVYWFKK